MSTEDESRAAEAIVAAAARVSNWGRWGDDDRLGTLNHVGAADRVRAAGLVRTGEVHSLAQPFSSEGPQKGWRRRTNPVHTMTDTGVEAVHGDQGFPHGFGGADDVIAMPLQCSTQWDGLGHIFDHGRAWNGRSAAVVTSEGDSVTGIETTAEQFVARGVLLDVGAALGSDGELPDGFAITPDHLEATIAAQGESSAVGRGDVLMIRTGHYTRARRDGWGDYAGGPAPGMSFTSLDWVHAREVSALATDTWGAEVRPPELPGAFQPFHQVAIPHMGLFLGEMWAPDGLAAACAVDGRYDFLLVAPTLPIVGAVGSPTNPLAIR
ncbi:cyclase family protein [Georgenia sp. Z1491]|uniref:cyclase family protein n=1 Tax=Georgenia sp. Z1491 TaxID=3416707 RepID=UPI003CF4248C